jgi:hypothetical protein
LNKVCQRTIDDSKKIKLNEINKFLGDYEMKAKQVSNNCKSIVINSQSDSQSDSQCKELCDEELMAITGGMSCIGRPTNNTSYSIGFGSRFNK